MKKAFIFLCLPLIFYSCISQKDLTYFQDLNDTSKVTTGDSALFKSFEPVIQANDILAIYVNSLSPEASSFFNPVFIDKQGTASGTDAQVAMGYLVDINGNIEMPLIGKVQLGGLTTEKAREVIKKQLDKYLQNPTLRIYFQNYRITILGEVSKPGVYNVPNERITLPELLGLAGDLTPYGDRSNVLIVREQNNEKKYLRINLKTKEVFNSESFFLHPNDIVYVTPVKSRAAQADIFYRVFPIVISTLTFLAVIMSRVIR